MSKDTPAAEPLSDEALFYPQAEPEAVKPEVDQPEEAEEEADEDSADTSAETEAEAESEESEEEESEDGTEDQAEDGEQLYVEIGGREITVSQILEWEKGSLRQSDYTQKSMKNAQEKRDWEEGKDKAVEDAVKSKLSALDDSVANLESLIDVDDKATNWEDLKEFEPEEYIKKTELKQKREQALSKAKAERLKLDEDNIANTSKAELKVLSDNHPEWFDTKGATTQAYTDQIAQANKYFTDNGWSEKDQKGIKSAKQWEAIFQAAGKNAAKTKTKAKLKEIKKLPLTTKRKSKSSSKQKSDEELFYG